MESRNKIIIHIESGLGNQMLSYCELLALKSVNPQEDIYIENIIYDIPECNEVIKQWNGYELERIFGIKQPNIKELFNDKQWNRIMKEIYETQFWKHEWNYPVYITQALNNEGMHLKNIRGNFERGKKKQNPFIYKLKWNFHHRTALGVWLRRKLYILTKEKRIAARYVNQFIEVKEDIYTGQNLNMAFKGNGIEKIDKEVRKAFTFPEFTDEKNIELVKMLDECNSIAIHVRRGDIADEQEYLYRFGYFRRAVKYIKRHVKNPCFVFFCDPGSENWCRNNEKSFALNFDKENVFFCNWNRGNQSFRDMQCIAHCKHAIITNSTFGWWGAYFIQNPSKITISPIEYSGLNTTHQC